MEVAAELEFVLAAFETVGVAEIEEFWLGDVVAGTTVIKLIEQEKVSAEEVFVPQEAGYIPIFPQVVQLTEYDIELVQRALEVSRDSGNERPVMAVTEKIKSLMGIQTDMTPIKFLYTIIKDFQHLTAR